MAYNFEFKIFIKRFFLLLSALFFLACLKGEAYIPAEASRLEKGEVITKILPLAAKDGVKGAEASIFIAAPPEKIWNILFNQENLPKLAPKFKEVNIIEKNNNYQKVQVALKVSSLLPTFRYTMYLDTSEKYKRVKFSRIEGAFKKLYGSYELEPYQNGTILTYRMFIDMGFFVPDFIYNEGLKKDLPEILGAIKTASESN